MDRRITLLSMRFLCCHQIRSNFIKVIIVISVLIAFSHNIYSNIEVYEKRHTVVEMSEIADPPAKFPPVIICPVPISDLLKLLDLGLNITVNDVEELLYNVDNLVGVDRTMTGKELVEKAGWRVEDLVQNVTIGDFVQESYSEEKTVPSPWKRSFTPMGPCWTFTAPPTASLHSLQMTIYLNQPKSYRSCLWNDGYLQHYNEINRFCNNSSVWSDYLWEKFFVIIPFLTSTHLFYDIMNAKTEMPVEFNSLYALAPFQIASDVANERLDKSTACLHRIFLEDGQSNVHCIPIYHDTLYQPLESLCVTLHDHYSSFMTYLDSEVDVTVKNKLERKCQANPNELRWKVEDVRNYGYETFTVELTSSTTKLFYKRLLYPLGKLLEDIGGSLGLFLGTSFLDLWLYVIEFISFVSLRGMQILQRDLNALQQKKLLTISGNVAVAVPFCVHCGIALNRYISSSELYVAFIDRSIIPTYFVPRVNLSLEQALIAFSSSRPLGCQVMSLHPQQKHLFQCLLGDVYSLPASSLYVDDLPICHDDYILPRVKYISEKDLILSSVSESKRDYCKNKHQLYDSSFQSNVYFSLNLEPSTSLADLFCSLGGIIGLYFGYSLLGSLEALKLSKCLRAKKANFYCVLFVSAKIIIFLGCATFCINSLLKYLWNHPIYTTSSKRSLTMTDLPVMTLCIWPPFNVTSLFIALGFANEINAISYMNPDRRYSAVTQFMKSMKYFNDTSMLDPVILWADTAWNERELHYMVFSRELYLDLKKYGTAVDSKSVFNMCYSANFKGYQEAEAIDINARMNWLIQPREIYKNTMMNVFFHQENQFPPLSLNVHEVSSREKVHLLKSSRWEGIHGRSLVSGRCLSQCIDESFTRKIECRLPWVEILLDVQVCNFTQFLEFLSYLWNLHPINSSFSNTFLDEEDVQLCSDRCGEKSQFFYAAKYGANLTVGPGFGFNFKFPQTVDLPFSYFDFFVEPTSFEETLENDGYTVPQFLSEVGGIIGMTLGISLVSLLLKIVQGRKTQDD